MISVSKAPRRSSNLVWKKPAASFIQEVKSTLANANRVHRRLGRTSLHCVFHRSIDGRYRPVHAVAQVVKIKKTSGQRIDMPRDDPSGHGDLSLLPRGGHGGIPYQTTCRGRSGRGKRGGGARRDEGEGHGEPLWTWGALAGGSPKFPNIPETSQPVSLNLGEMWDGRDHASRQAMASQKASQPPSQPTSKPSRSSSVFGLRSSVFNLLP